MRRPTICLLSVLAILLLANVAGTAEHEELQATPGLWKITYRVRIDGKPDPAILKWRCVSEEEMEDPALVFARPALVQGTCTRTSYRQTATAINWKYHCVSGPANLNTEGAINFDTHLHYTGHLRINGVVMGYPVQNVIAVEGEHRAACTSPED
jgi:Protein of unknown function (DUF3617)